MMNGETSEEGPTLVKLSKRPGSGWELPLTILTQLTIVSSLSGLGFNVVGGNDQPYIPGDKGIFVSKIRKEGVAYEDGRLKEGDRILSVNGEALADVEHDEAVRLLRSVPLGQVTLEVEAEAERTAVNAAFSPSSSRDSFKTVINASEATGGVSTPNPSSLPSPTDPPPSNGLLGKEQNN